MRISIAAAALLLAACAAPTPREPASPALDVPDISGDYSNFGQALEVDAPDETWDLQVRTLEGQGSGHLLVTRTLRSSGQRSTRLFQLSPGPDDSLELQIALLGEADEELAPGALLAWAQDQFLPGCVLTLQRDDQGWLGQTQPETCRVMDPVHGEVGVLHQVGLYPERFLIDSRVLGREDPDVQLPQVYDRVHEYRAWASIQRWDAAKQPTGMVTSAVSTIRSDGRQVRLSEPDGTRMEISLQMAYLRWQPDEPDYLRLDAYNAESGALLGYYWARPEATKIEFNGDWLMLWAERSAEPKQPGFQPGE
jgi:hypothetical protein